MEQLVKDMKPANSKETWGTWMKSACMFDISDEHFMDFQQESLKLIQKYQRLSKKPGAVAGTSGSSTPACQVTQVNLPPQTESPAIATVLNSVGQPIHQQAVHQQAPLAAFSTIDQNAGVFGQNYSSGYFPPSGNP